LVVVESDVTIDAAVGAWIATDLRSEGGGGGIGGVGGNGGGGFAAIIPVGEADG